MLEPDDWVTAVDTTKIRKLIDGGYSSNQGLVNFYAGYRAALDCVDQLRKDIQALRQKQGHLGANR